MQGLAMTAFKLAGADACEFLLLPFGEHRTVDGKEVFRFDPPDAAAVVAAFKARGLEMLVDYEHQSIAHLQGMEAFKSPDGKAPAAGWIKDLAVKADGLWATGVKWTSDAAKMIRDRAYRYFSPVMLWQNDNPFGRVRGIYNIGLTNDPRLENAPMLVAKCDLGALLNLQETLAMPPSHSAPHDADHLFACKPSQFAGDSHDLHAKAIAWLGMNPSRTYAEAIDAALRIQAVTALKGGQSAGVQFEHPDDRISPHNPTGEGLANLDLHQQATAWLRHNPSRSYVEAIQACWPA